MSVTVREHLEASSLAAPLNLATGAGTAVDDVVLALHFTAFYSAADMQAPSGGGTWQGPIAIARNDATNSPHIKAWWLPVASGGAISINFNHAQGDPPHNAALLVLTGADTVNPVSGFGVLDDAFGTAQVAPSVTGEADGLLMCGWVSDDVVTYTFGSMTGFNTNNGFNAAGAAYELLVSNGATGTRTATSSAAKTHSAISIAIRAGGAVAPVNVGLSSTSMHPGRGPSRFARFFQRAMSTEVVVGAVERELDGQAPVAVDASALASVERPIEGHGDAASSASASLSITLAVAASAPVAASASAAPDVARALSASSNAASGASAELSVRDTTPELAGSMSAAAFAQASTVVTRGMASAAAAAASATLDLSVFAAYDPAFIAVEGRGAVPGSDQDTETKTSIVDGRAMVSGVID